MTSSARNRAIVNMLSGAIQTYHDLLTDAAAADSQAQLDDQTRRRQFTFGDRPVCSVLRPRFLTPWQFRPLQDRLQLLLPAFARLYQAALDDKAFRSQFRLRDEEEALLA